MNTFWFGISCFILMVRDSLENRQDVKIGGLFDFRSPSLSRTFFDEIQRHSTSSNDLRFYGIQEVVDCLDSYNVSNAICHLLEEGVHGIVGAFNPCALSTIQSYTDTFNVPFISLGMPQLSTSDEPYQLYIRPSYMAGLLDLVSKKEWKFIYYMYESNEGLLRLQKLFQSIYKKEVPLDIDPRRIVSIFNGHELLRSIYNKQIGEDIRVFLDLPQQRAEELIIAVKNDPDISNVRFQFVLVDLVITEMSEQVLSVGLNVSGYSVQDLKSYETEDHLNKEETFGPDLVRDALQVFSEAFQTVSPITETHSEFVGCRDNRIKLRVTSGKRALKSLKSVEIKGKSGQIIFDKNGFRTEYKLIYYETSMHVRISKVGIYTEGKGLHTHPPVSTIGKPVEEQQPKEKIQRIETVLEEPYVMYTEEASLMNPRPTCGIENFKGYIIDLIIAVAEHINFNYTVCLVPSYGIKLPNGTWTGLIGRLTHNMTTIITLSLPSRLTDFIMINLLIRLGLTPLLTVWWSFFVEKDPGVPERTAHLQQAADIGFGGLTISSERERVVDFTKPFMSLGISIIIKKPENKKTHTFSFMDPLSYEIWMCILFAYVGVSVVLFLVSRFSPTEWKIEDDKTIKNAFTISNSLWYSLGAFMQQGCDISPKSVPGRIVGSVWWFFTLIIISSYTANLAAFLTVERMNTPIESAEDLAKQTKIQYGTYRGGTTYDFFKLSKVAVYERMFAYMTSAKDIFVDSTQDGIQKVRSMNGKYAYLIESTTNEYVNSRKPCDTMKVGSNLDSKGYGIATPIGSPLRDKLTLAVLHLREKSKLLALKKKWWQDTSECPETNTVAGSEAELKLKNVAGIFYILIGGLSMSIIIAFLEFLYKSILEYRKSKEAFGTILKNKARLSFRGSIDEDQIDASTPLNKSVLSGTYKYIGPRDLPGFDPYEEPTNIHTAV